MLGDDRPKPSLGEVEFVIRAQTAQGPIVLGANWSRQMVIDFADALKRGAMLFGNNALLMDMGADGLKLETFTRAPKLAESEIVQLRDFQK